MLLILRHLSIFLIITILTSCGKQDGDSKLLQSILDSMKDDYPKVVRDSKKYRIQIIYTQVDRNPDQLPNFTTYYYHFDPEKYFYPASTVKFPAVLLALEKVNHYQSLGLKKELPLTIGVGYEGQTAVEGDSTSENGKASIAHYIKKIFVVSDNDAYNRLYEFLGKDAFNQRMWDLGYPETRIRHRLSIPLSSEQNRYTNPITFYDEKGKPLFNQPQWRSVLNLSINSNENLIGKAHMVKGVLVKSPMDFSVKNFFNLDEQQRLLRQIIFPSTAPENNRLDLTRNDYVFLYEWMSKLPRESHYPTYPDYDKYYDSFCKFFMYGSIKEQIPDYIRIFNKVGWAYGFLTDNAYIIDTKNSVEFFLSAVIYVNENQILNDDVYEFKEKGLPFFTELGNRIYEYELNRKRTVKPDFSHLYLTEN